MWVITTRGFISVVKHRHIENALMVRGRDQNSLVELARVGEAQIEFTANADYAWRTTVSREALAEYLANEVSRVDYFNFKDEMHFARPEYEDALFDVWKAMHKVEDGPAQERYKHL